MRNPYPPLYDTWQSMRQRCRRPQHPDFPRYGGRGISICERWQTFENFAEDMGPRPTANHSLDRIDNDGNYEPANCRWATAEEQSHNRSTTRWFTINGESKPLNQWCREYGLYHSTVARRIDKFGWTVERALTEHLRRPHSCSKKAVLKAETNQRELA